MKTLDTLENGDRIVRISREEWDGLGTATEIAFGDEESVPAPMRETAVALWQVFHAPQPVAPIRADFATAAEMAELDRVRRAADNVIRLLPARVGDWSRGGDLSGAVHWAHETEEIPLVYATPNWEGEPNTPLNVTDGGAVVEENAGDLPFDATQWIGREEAGAAEYVRLLRPVLDRLAAQYAGAPKPPADWTLYGTGGNCTAFRREKGGLEFLITEKGEPSAPRPGVACVVGAYENGELAFERSEPTLAKAVEFVERFGFVRDGVAFYAFPKGGSFLGVTQDDDALADQGAEVAAGDVEAREAIDRATVLLSCPMNADGTASPGENGESICEVENIEGLDLDEVNGFFGTAFAASDFTGR